MAGHLDILVWARLQGCPWDQHTCAGAAEGGQLDVFKWLREQVTHVLKWPSWDDLRLIISAFPLVRQGCPWSEDTCRAAAEGGQLHVLQWAIDNGCPVDSSTAVGAAVRGHLDVLQWAISNGCPWDEGTCEAAASGGHLNVLQWAHRQVCVAQASFMVLVPAPAKALGRFQGCPWDEETCREAAEAGHLDCLKWARANGCPWDKSVCIECAFQNGHLHVCQWAVIQEP